MENRFDGYKMKVFIQTHNRKRRKDKFHKEFKKYIQRTKRVE